MMLDTLEPMRAEDCEVRAKGYGVFTEGSLRRSFESEAKACVSFSVDNRPQNAILPTMRALDKFGSAFLRLLFRRMKELGLNQSALARRMKVSRAYVSKALAGDVNFSFSTACRFAKALEMDFLPSLASREKKESKSTLQLQLETTTDFP